MSPDLAALVGSRICHDLISPIGAIGNGVELLSLTDGDTGPEMQLINESVQNANARIRYFRIAYGATSDDQMISRAEIVSILAATARGGRFTYFWNVEGEQSRRLVRCALLLMQCFEAALPMGGDIHVVQEGDQWRLSAEGPRLSVDGALWDTMSRPVVGYEYTAAQVQFALIPGVMAEAGRRLRLTMDTDKLVAVF
ncbi:histidine phosphotransferase family protein [Cognatiyoonia sp. IB215182]|uniref:histidine phosphotransferase family protein n=1 Tax=Cognatiyoonia sp. IB215182 TaxID=3097353 RepID=UPI002A0BD9CA|nr:histidine phosphotransferase family protein [Cognatiyoonia sp. IB215182]MDX8353565.1 histidine phosphotransferase family protein [Cognatiyoonia sp. IB215182]